MHYALMSGFSLPPTFLAAAAVAEFSAQGKTLAFQKWYCDC